ncbi:hypothetical protein RhiJN_17060 [Ceratobasidium sp. AG-Ba]|nr:hypothetical protein RhiJN_17060 [Ceratobasidium sp. AG-Ba]
MFGFQLNKTRSLTSQINASQPTSVHTAAASSPEPKATESGIIPGQALFNKQRTRSPTGSESSKSQSPPPSWPYSLRAVRVVTSKYAELKARIAERQEKRKNRKTPRKKNSNGSLASTAASRKSTTTQYVSDSEPDRSCHEDDSIGRTPAQSENRGSGFDRRISGQGIRNGALEGTATAGVPGLPGATVEDSCVDDDTGRSAPVRESSGQPRTTSGQNRDPSQLPADYWNFELDHERLSREVARLAEINPEELSQIPPEDLEAILERLVDELPASKRQQYRSPSASQQAPQDSEPGVQAAQASQGSQATPGQQAPSISQVPRQAATHGRRQTEGQAHTVQPPRSSVQARLVSNVPIVLGGGHHLNQPWSTNRPGPDTNTETEPETEPELENKPNKPIINPSSANPRMSS